MTKHDYTSGLAQDLHAEIMNVLIEVGVTVDLARHIAHGIVTGCAVDQAIRDEFWAGYNDGQ